MCVLGVKEEWIRSGGAHRDLHLASSTLPRVICMVKKRLAPWHCNTLML